MTLEIWEIVLLAIAAYLAITTLVKLMQRRHDEFVVELRARIEAERKRRRMERRRQALEATDNRREQSTERAA